MNNSPRQLTHVRAALYGKPMAISDEGFADICAVVESHAAGLETPTVEPNQHRKQLRANLAAMFGPEVLAEEDSPYEIIRGCALIPISGILMATAPAAMFRNISNATSYGEIANAFDAALAEESVAVIIPVFYSPGGECSKCFDVCELVFAANERKPVVGFIDGLCASAAYAIASQCLEALCCTPHSRVGSIGILGGVHDTTRRERNEGVDTTVIRSSELKGIGEGPLTPNQLQSIKAELNSLFSVFKSMVSRGRAGIDIAAVATGETWYGQDSSRPSAVEMGLVDKTATLNELIEEFGT